MSKIQTIRNNVKSMIGGEALGKPYYRFLLVHTCFMIFNRLPSVFINTLLFGQTNDIKVVIMYNATFFVGSAISMLAAAEILHRFGPGITAVIGIGGYNILYLMLIILGGNASVWHLALGLFAGIADGFYWLSYGGLVLDVTDLSNRDSGVSIISICANVVNLTVPLLAGFMIDIIGGTGGYIAVFSVAFVMSAVTCVLALCLPKRKLKRVRHVRYRKTVKGILKNKQILYALSAQGCKGIREGVFTFILSIVLYQMVKSELAVAFNTFLAAMAAIISFIIASRILTRQNRVTFMRTAVIVLSAMALASIFKVYPIMIFIYTLVNSFFAGFLELPTYSTFLDMVEMVPSVKNNRPELIAINDLMLEIGRCIGIGFFLIITAFKGESVEIQILSLFVLTLTQFGTVFLCGAAVKTAEKLKAK